MTPDEVDAELGRLLDEHLKKRSIGVHELVTQAFAVGCKYRAGIEDKNPESTALRAALTSLREELDAEGERRQALGRSIACTSHPGAMQAKGGHEGAAVAYWGAAKRLDAILDPSVGPRIGDYGEPPMGFAARPAVLSHAYGDVMPDAPPPPPVEGGGR